MNLTYRRKQQYTLLNVYEINIRYEHGDADCTTYNTIQLHGFLESQVIEYIEKFEILADLIENREDFNADDYIVNGKEIELERDVVYSGSCLYAPMEIESIVYHDHAGVMFDVTYQ